MHDQNDFVEKVRIAISDLFQFITLGVIVLNVAWIGTLALFQVYFIATSCDTLALQQVCRPSSLYWSSLPPPGDKSVTLGNRKHVGLAI